MLVCPLLLRGDCPPNPAESSRLEHYRVAAETRSGYQTSGRCKFQNVLQNCTEELSSTALIDSSLVLKAHCADRACGCSRARSIGGARVWQTDHAATSTLAAGSAEGWVFRRSAFCVPFADH